MSSLKYTKLPCIAFEAPVAATGAVNLLTQSSVPIVALSPYSSKLGQCIIGT